MGEKEIETACEISEQEPDQISSGELEEKKIEPPSADGQEKAETEPMSADGQEETEPEPSSADGQEKAEEEQPPAEMKEAQGNLPPVIPISSSEITEEAPLHAPKENSGLLSADMAEEDPDTEDPAVYLARKQVRTLRAVVILLVIVLLLGAMYLRLMSPERWTLSIRMKGSPELTLYQGDKYVEKGCTAKCRNDLTGAVRTLAVRQEGEVDTKKPGSYTITYTAKYLGKTISRQRIITVTPNYAEARKVSMYDTFSSGSTAPVIGLYGGSKITVYDAFGFKEGYVATDDKEGYITDQVKVNGTVDPDTPGSYLLGYSVTDSDGQLSLAERMITVKKFPLPVLRELNPDEKIIYLTFDDGPGQYTDAILSILDKYKVKATFFVTATAADKNYLNLIRKEAEQGHAVGVHSYTHKYDQIYSNDQAFWDDFNAMNDIIKEQTGRKTDIMRFPGGGSNTVSKKYCPGIMTRLANEATSQGYWYFDWNVLSGDAGDTKDSGEIVERMKAGVLKNGRSIILCHDTHEYTLNALEPFLQWALSCGYSFDSLRNGYFAAHQTINN